METLSSNRLKLHSELCDILGSSNVYFQPPASVKMAYPAIVYSRRNIDNIHANNDIYTRYKGYQATVIDKNPDSEIVERLSTRLKCRFERHFTSDNLNHFVFVLYS